MNAAGAIFTSPDPDPFLCRLGLLALSSGGFQKPGVFKVSALRSNYCCWLLTKETEGDRSHKNSFHVPAGRNRAWYDCENFEDLVSHSV